MAQDFPNMIAATEQWDAFADTIDETALNGTFPFIDQTQHSWPAETMHTAWSDQGLDPYDALTIGSPLCTDAPSCYAALGTGSPTSESISSFSAFSGTPGTPEDHRVILQTPMAGPKEKRKAQNRAAQRAFRERKEKRVQELQDDMSKMAEELSSLRAEMSSLRAHSTRLTTSLIRAKDVIAALRIVCASEKPSTLSAADVYNIGR